MLASVLYYADAGGKAGPKLFYPAAGAGFGCLAATLVLLRRPWEFENVMRRMAAALGCLYASFLLGAWVQSCAGPAEPSTRQMVISSLSIHGAGFILVALFLREHGMGWTEAFGLGHRRGRAVLVGIVMAGLFLPVGQSLQAASALALERLSGLGVKPEAQQAVQVIQQAAAWPARAVLGVVTILLAPVGEELLFRGILYPWIKQAGFPRLALWGTCGFFAAIHVNLMIFVPLFVLALLLTLLYERTNNLLAPIAAHSVFNALGFVLLCLK